MVRVAKRNKELSSVDPSILKWRPDELAYDDEADGTAAQNEEVDEEQEEELYPLDVHDSDEDEDEEEEEEVDDQEEMDLPAGVASELVADDIQDRDAEEEADFRAWGKSKRTFYDADEDLSDEEDEETAAIAEEKEAKRMRKEKLALLRQEDFINEDEETFATLIQKKKDGSATATPAQSEKKTASKPSTVTPPPAVGKLDDAEVEEVQRDVSTFTREQKLKFIQADSPELLELLKDFKTRALEIRDTIRPLLARVRAGELPTTKGLSFLEVKYHLLLSYCTNLAFYMLLKARGQRVKDHPVIDTLVRLRTIIDKMRPIDKKLKYQIDKLMKTATLGNIQHAIGADGADIDPLRFRPNPRGLATAKKGNKPAKSAPTGEEDIDKVSDEASAAEDGDEAVDTVDTTNAASGKYVPPKLHAEYYDGPEDERAMARKEREEERKRRRVQRSAMAQFIREEFSEAPEVDDAIGGTRGAAADARRRADAVDEFDSVKRDFEEEHFVRLPETREERQKRKRKLREMAAVSDGLADLADFGDLASLSTNGDAKRMGGREVMDALRRGTLRSLINKAEGTGAQTSVDAELPYREPKRRKIAEPPRENKRDKEKEDEEFINNDDFVPLSGKQDSEALPEEDPFYEAIAKQTAQRKAAKAASKQAATQARVARIRDDPTVEEGQKREITYQIEKNKGLTPHRKKENRNPRKKHRNKYEKAMKKMATMRRGGASASAGAVSYGGESTGIKTNVARSRKLQ